MSYNKSIMVNSLNKVTKKLFKEAIYLAYKGGITSVAPLGFSGDTILLYAKNGESRKSQISIRNYGNDAELLITDNDGSFIFYGRFHISNGIGFVLDQYWNIFKSVRDKIETKIKERPDFANLEITNKAIPTIGFDMLRTYQNTCGGHIF